MLNVSGIAASAGIAIAKAFILEHPDYSVEKRQINDVDAEIAKLLHRICSSWMTRN
jgi:phosphoenolpyruvate-protein phosphotransferase (PTS system enzyme I)